MPNNVVHFAIHADDVERAKTFYAAVFGWRFEAWGPPGFFNIRTGEGGIMGALEKRQVPLSGTGVRAFTCTVSVEDLDATIQAIGDAGGTVSGQPFTIPTVGRLIQFSDLEGNMVSAMQYDLGVLQ
ncbi:MAG: VOC family protein [Nannocystaceae bacterium]|nr:VOC family protein [Nannocystaceae bacterium]